MSSKNDGLAVVVGFRSSHPENGVLELSSPAHGGPFMTKYASSFQLHPPRKAPYFGYTEIAARSAEAFIASYFAPGILPKPPAPLPPY